MGMNADQGLFIGDERQAQVPVLMTPRRYTTSAEAQSVRLQLTAVLQGER